MFHKAVELKLKEGTSLEVTFQSGEIKSYDMAVLFKKYPVLEALKDRTLFEQGKLMGAYGIVWNDDIDIEVETIYEDGITVGTAMIPANTIAALTLQNARARVGLSQKELSELTGIDQSDISKIERGVANPSVSTLERLARAMGMEVSISIE